jgi:hypothetical protein
MKREKIDKGMLFITGAGCRRHLPLLRGGRGCVMPLLSRPCRRKRVQGAGYRVQGAGKHLHLHDEFILHPPCFIVHYQLSIINYQLLIVTHPLPPLKRGR